MVRGISLPRTNDHYGHFNILRFQNRPFKDIEEHDQTLISNNNEVVSDGDIVYHFGDFAFRNRLSADWYIQQLNGEHRFLIGSHDHWMKKRKVQFPQRIETTIEGQKVVGDHYAMRSWRWSIHGSWQLHGHSHGRLSPIGLQLDVGVDSHDFYPWSWNEICEEMKTRGGNID